MTSLAVRLTEIDDDQLEEFIELWIEQKSNDYHLVERIGAANDKGRDVIGFLNPSKHEGPWHLYQCKRKTRGSKTWKARGALRNSARCFVTIPKERTATLPTRDVFVSPRGIVGPLLAAR